MEVLVLLDVTIMNSTISANSIPDMDKESNTVVDTNYDVPIRRDIQ